MLKKTDKGHTGVPKYHNYTFEQGIFKTDDKGELKKMIKRTTVFKNKFGAIVDKKVEFIPIEDRGFVKSIETNVIFVREAISERTLKPKIAFFVQKVKVSIPHVRSKRFWYLKTIPSEMKYSYFGTEVVEKSIEIWLYDHYHDHHLRINPAYSFVRFLTKPKRIDPIKAMKMLENFEAWGIFQEDKEGELYTRIMQLPPVKPRIR